ncbi:hypothetical protein ACWDN6_14610 [Streptomyces albogriseolus]
MARNIGADGSTVYRAVITKTYDNGREWTSHEGPYTEPGPARARVSFWRNRMRRNGGTAEGHIEQAHTVWAPVGEDADPTAAIRAQAYRDAAAQLDQRASSLDALSSSDHDAEAYAVRELADAANALRALADAVHLAPQEPQP